MSLGCLNLSFLLNLTLKWPINPDVSGDVSPEDPEIKAAIAVHAVQATEQADSYVFHESILLFDLVENDGGLASQVQKLVVVVVWIVFKRESS